MTGCALTARERRVEENEDKTESQIVYEQHEQKSGRAGIRYS